MIACQDLIDLVRAYNPKTDEKLVSAAYDYGREMHEGQFDIQSQVDVGTTVTIRLRPTS